MGRVPVAADNHSREWAGGLARTWKNACDARSESRSESRGGGFRQGFRIGFRGMVSVIFGLIFASVSYAQFPGPPVRPSAGEAVGETVGEGVGYPNWKLRTFGGLQFWTDIRYVGGWKIQRHAQTGHHRLVDANRTRIAWGDLRHCNRRLDTLISQGTVVRDAGDVVIVIHGLVRTSGSMKTMANYLEREGGYTVVNYQYASSREIVETHAQDLESLILGLGPDVTEINFVCHSLGNIVVRCYLGNARRTSGRDGRIARMVMLGPPNQGSAMATVLKNSFLFKTIAGASGSQLGTNWKLLEPKLVTPDFEFGIIAGGQDHDGGMSNVILRGPDDFTVGLEEAKLAGAQDILVRPLLHGTMMKQPEVLESTLRFLQHGFFVSENARQSISVTWHR